MLRLTLPAVLTMIMILGIAPGAAAKQITSMEVCGPSDCAKVKRSTAQRWHQTGALGGSRIERVVGRTAHYRVIAGVGHGSDEEAGTFSMAYSPGLRAMLPMDDYAPGVWMRLSDPVAMQLARLTRGIAAFPARRLVADSPRDASGTLPPEVVRPASAATTESDDLPPALLAGVPLALLAGLTFVGIRRRRPGH